MKYIALLTFILLLVVSCTPRTDSSFPATPAVTLSISPTQAFTPTPPPSPTPSATPSPTLTPTSTVTPEPKAVISPDNVAQLKTVLTVENRYGSPHAMFSPDGRLLVAKTSPFGEGNKSVSKLFFWNLETLQEASPLETADRIFFTHLAFDVDGQSILVGTWPNTSQAISLLRLSDGQHILDIPVPRESLGRIVRRIALSPDGQWIAIGFTDGELEIYARKDGQRVFQEKIKSARNVSIIEALAFSPDSRFLAAGGAEKTIYLWSTSDWKMLTTFAPGKGTIFDLAFSPDGSFLAAAEGGSDGRVSLWNVQTPEAKAPVASFPFPSFSVEFSPDGSLLVAGGANGHLSFWRTDTYEQVARLPAHKTRIEALDFSPDGQFLASGSATTSRPYELKLWRVPAP